VKAKENRSYCDNSEGKSYSDCPVVSPRGTRKQLSNAGSDISVRGERCMKTGKKQSQ